MASRNIRLGLSFNNRMENSRGGKVSILCFSLFFFFFLIKEVTALLGSFAIGSTSGLLASWSQLEFLQRPAPVDLSRVSEMCFPDSA